jgi:Amidase
MSKFGPLATTAADLGLALDVLAGGDAYRAVAPPDRPLRVGISARPGAVGVRVDPEVRAAMDATAEALAGAGHRVETVEPPWRSGDAAQILQRVFYGCAEDVDRLPAGALERRTVAPARVGRVLRRAWPAPSGPPGRILARYRAWFEDHDVLLTPTLATPPLRVGAYQGKGLVRTLLGLTAYMPFPPPLNLVGFPAASVPAGISADGLPLGGPAGRRPRRRGAAAVSGPPAGDAAPLAPPCPAGAGRGLASALVGAGGDEEDDAVLGQEVEVVAAVGEGDPLDVGRAGALAGEPDRPGWRAADQVGHQPPPSGDGSPAA